MIIPDLVVVDSSAAAAASCVVCGKDIAAGEGVTALFQGRTLRFKCPGCLSRFAVDPDHILSAEPTCCDRDEREQANDPDPVSEWVG